MPSSCASTRRCDLKPFISPRHGHNSISSFDDSPPQDRILCVDDDSILLKLLVRSFQAHHFKVVTACNGIDGLRQFQAYGGHFQAILTDNDMPGMNGLEFVKQVRALSYKGPVLVMSANLMPSDYPAYQGHAVSGFFHKPFEINRVATMLMQDN